MNSEFDRPNFLFYLTLLALQGGSMDLSKIGEKILSSVRSARSLGILPSLSDRPEIPAKAAAAAAVARALAGLPPHQRFTLSSSFSELSTIYGSRPRGRIIEELEEDFYVEDFDPVRHVLEHIPSDGNDLSYLEEKATLRLAQLDHITERLSRHVMEHHEKMVKGMQLVMELEQDLKVANVICKNGRRHLASSMNEVSRDLVVNTNARKKQVLLDMLPILTELHHATNLQHALETHVHAEDYFKAFQVLSEYLQILESFQDLSAIQEMSHGVEIWLGKTLQKLDSILLSVCQEFNDERYITVVDAYALVGDKVGLAEKILSFFMQEVISGTHTLLKDIVNQDLGLLNAENSRFTYSDLCLQIPESKFRECLLKTLDLLFKLMRSYYAIMTFYPKKLEADPKSSSISYKQCVPTKYLENEIHPAPMTLNNSISENISVSDSMNGFLNHEFSGTIPYLYSDDHRSVPDEINDDDNIASSSGSPGDQLRKDAVAFVAQTLQRGRKNLWQLTTSRVSVLLSCSVVCSMSTHQFLRNYEDLSVFILAGESFCGVEAVEFRKRLKNVCENYLKVFHRQNICALRMVLEKETWLTISPDTIQAISLAGLVGDGAPLIVAFDNHPFPSLGSKSLNDPIRTRDKENGFAPCLKAGNTFLSKLAYTHTTSDSSILLHNESSISCESDVKNVDFQNSYNPKSNKDSNKNINNAVLEDENEDLLADFIDEDSQLPSRISKPSSSRNHSSNWNDEDSVSQTGSSLCLLRLMDKYARLMQKLEIVNFEFFKGICQLFEVFCHHVFEIFGYQDGGKGTESLSYRLKIVLSRINQDCEQWIKPQISSPVSFSNVFMPMDVTPTIPSTTNHTTSNIFGLKERCSGAETLSLIARILIRSRRNLQSMLPQNSFAFVEDFYANIVDSVPDLTETIHRVTSRSLLHINGYVERIANAKWEIKELGMDHNGYADLLLGEFKHYKTRLAHGGISKQVQDLLLEYGVESIAETLIEGLSRVKRCTDEGRALMSLDLQVLISGLQHLVSINVKPKMEIVEAFIKAYYLPETEYVHWALSHPEYTKSQIIGLINLVATMKSWKRKTRLEVIEKIESSII